MEKPTYDKFVHKGDKTPLKGKVRTYKAKHGESRVIVAAKFDLSIETLTRLNPQIENWRDIEGETLNVLP